MDVGADTTTPPATVVDPVLTVLVLLENTVVPRVPVAKSIAL